MVFTLRFFFSLKCSLFHNSNLFVSCIIHILYTVCAKIKKIIPAPKVNEIQGEAECVLRADLCFFYFSITPLLCFSDRKTQAHYRVYISLLAYSYHLSPSHRVYAEEILTSFSRTSTFV